MFAPRGWDWRWLSWSEAAARVSAAAAELRPSVEVLAASLSRPPRLAFSWAPGIERVLLDQALQAVGAVSVPLPETDIEPRGSAEIDDIVDPPPALSLDAPLPRRDPTADEPGRGGRGGVRVRDPSGVCRDLGGEDLVSMVDAWAAETLARAAPERPIWVSARALSDPGERLVFTWALHIGAAVVLASPDTHVANATWARPTVFSGDAAEVTALAEAARSYKPPFPRGLIWRLRAALRRRLRPAANPLPPPLPFDRLHTVLVRREAEGAAAEDPATALPQPVAAFLRERGTRIASLPVHLDAALWRRSYNIGHRGGTT